MNWEVELLFKNGEYIDYIADSYWTEYHHIHNYYKYMNWVINGIREANENYLCFYDWCTMNPVSRETKRADFKNIRDKIQATGNECNYFEENGTFSDDWCISVRYEQLNAAYVYTGSNWVTLYENGEKKN